MVMIFSSSHVWVWELDCEEGWALKNCCFWTVVLEKTLESPLDCKENQPVHSEGDQPWDFFGRNDAKAGTPVLWPPHVKSWPIGKDSDAGRDWGKEQKGTTEDEMAGWHQWLDGRESEWTPGVGDGQGSQRVGHNWATELNWTEWYFAYIIMGGDQHLLSSYCISQPVLISLPHSVLQKIFVASCTCLSPFEKEENQGAKEEETTGSQKWSGRAETGGRIAVCLIRGLPPSYCCHTSKCVRHWLFAVLLQMCKCHRSVTVT